MLEITEFKISAPDSDGDMRPEANIDVTNATDQTIKQVRYATAFLGHAGPVSFSNRNTENVTLDPGETTSFSAHNWIKYVATKGDRDDVTLLASARLMKRIFIKLSGIQKD